MDNRGFMSGSNKTSQGQPSQPQSLNNFFIPKVPPLSVTNLSLPPGKYSLGVDSTIPFVSLQGGGSSQKVFTWGEMIEVFPGQKVRIKNESYMQGDIQINSGWDFGAIPPKISLPVETNIEDNGTQTFYTPLYPADTRRCRRAYLKCQLITSSDPLNPNNNALFGVTGKPQKHSYPATDGITGQNNYAKIVILMDNSSYSSFSLGFDELETDDLPMALTDQATWTLGFQDNALPFLINNVFFYVLEY